MKKQILLAIIAKLKEEHAATLASATAAHQAATGEESKAENQYDTRGLEAGYLAEAQMKRAVECERLIALYTTMQDAMAHEAAPTQVAIGSLVKIIQGSRRSYYFIVNGAGGLSFNIEGRAINVITPQSPLGDALLNLEEGDSVEVEMQGGIREFTVESIA